jgi:hypothetical protein
MFDHESWRQQIAEALNGMARKPRQELQLAGTPTLLGFLVSRTLAPFWDAFQDEPIAAVLALANITRGPGADVLVRRAMRMRYQSSAQMDRELRANRDVRAAVEQLLVELQTIPMARQRLSSGHEGWLRNTLERELDRYPGEFMQLRRVLRDPGWQTRYEALRSLRNRQGDYTPADLVLIHDGLSDSAAHVRAAAVRALSTMVETPPLLLSRALVRVALHDPDAETRFAAARSIGALRRYLASPQLLDYLVDYLGSPDSFVRSAAALVLGQLGDYAGSHAAVRKLTRLLEDPDSYTREAAARALGLIGLAAANGETMAALQRAAANSDVNVHEAATDALARLREVRSASLPLAVNE